MNKLHHEVILFRTFAGLLLAALACVSGLVTPKAAFAEVRPALEPEPVYALPGTLELATDEDFLTFFVVENGSKYAIFGATPEVEAEITRIRDQRSGATVKVWGNLFPQGRQYTGPEIIATAVQEAEDAQPQSVSPPATPTPAPAPAPIAVGRFDYVNLHAQPDATSPVVGQIVIGEECDITGRNQNNSYLRVLCGDTEGWVASTVVNLQGDLSQIPVIEPEQQVSQIPIVVVAGPTPMETPPVDSWRALYYANRDLQGAPVLVQDVPRIDFNWGAGAPDPAVPVDNFSASYERVIDFTPGRYRLCICNLDDGARLWIDDELVLNDWREAPARDLVVDRQLSGPRRVRIEYFDAANLASISFTYAISDSRANVWQASYWNNTTLEGPIVMARTEPRPASVYPLDYDWGVGSPAPGVINPDLFSARWEGVFDFDAGSYIFEAIVDDGMRVYIDGTLVLTGWQDGYQEIRSGIYSIGRGQHQVRVEFFERTGNAKVRLRWFVDQSVREY